MTYNELLEEKARLQNLLKAQKEIIQLDITEIKNELKPATRVLKFVGKVGDTSKANPLLGFAVGMGTDILLRRFLFKKAGWIAKLVLPFVVRNASSRILTGTKNSLVKKLFSRIGKN
jgi:hypothetical protein